MSETAGKTAGAELREREAFEAAMRECWHATVDELRRRENGSYVEKAIYWMWEGWRLRAAHFTDATELPGAYMEASK